MDITTTFFTFIFGTKVGRDAQGNTYYRWRYGGKRYHRERRWVLFKKIKEASLVPPEWEAWLRHAVEEPIATQHHAYEKQPLPNLTGTAYATYPEGSVRKSGIHAATTNVYETWSPSDIVKKKAS